MNKFFKKKAIWPSFFLCCLFAMKKCFCCGIIKTDGELNHKRGDVFMNIQMAGIRNVNDALMCVECGVNIIGLLVGQAHTSDDFISKELARAIKIALPLEIKTTLITHHN